MTVTTLKPTRIVTRRRELPWRALFGVFLALLALVGGVAVLSSRDTVDIVVATRELAPGTVLQSADLGVATARLDGPLLNTTVPAAQAPTLVGKTLAEPVHSGQLLSRTELIQGEALTPGSVAMTIAPALERGPIGEFAKGDVVRVFVTVSRPNGPPATRVVLPSAIVYDLGSDDSLTALGDSGAEQGDTRITWLSLAVTPEEAVALANAKTSGDLDVALLPPAPPAGTR